MKILVLALLTLLPLVFGGCVTPSDQMTRQATRLLREAKADVVLTLPPELTRIQLEWITKDHPDFNSDHLPESERRIFASLKQPNIDALRRHWALLASRSGQTADALRAAYAPYLPPHTTTRETLRHLRFCGDVKNMTLHDFVRLLNNQLAILNLPKPFCRVAVPSDENVPTITFSFRVILGNELMDIVGNITKCEWAIDNDIVIIQKKTIQDIEQGAGT